MTIERQRDTERGRKKQKEIEGGGGVTIERQRDTERGRKKQKEIEGGGGG